MSQGTTLCLRCASYGIGGNKRALPRGKGWGPDGAQLATCWGEIYLTCGMCWWANEHVERDTKIGTMKKTEHVDAELVVTIHQLAG